METESGQYYRCRVCLEYCEDTFELAKLASIEDETVTYWNILLSVCTIETENINAPRTICTNCAQAAEVYHDFRMRCKSADKILMVEYSRKDLLNRTSSNIKDEDQYQEIIKIEIVEEKSDQENSTDFNKNLPILQKTETTENEYIAESNEFESEIYKPKKVPKTCESCNYKPKSMFDYRKHVSTHNQFRCENCGVTFKLMKSYGIHIKKNTCGMKECPEICNKCGYKPESLLDYNKHKKMHSEERKLDCIYCDQVFNTIKVHQDHLSSVHSDKKVGCTFCEGNYFTPRALVRHMKSTHPGEKVDCTVCDFNTDTYELYTKHMKENHEDIFCMRQCKFCDYTSVCALKLGRHMASVHPEKKDISCPKCDKKFFSYRVQAVHLKSEHQITEPHVCEICGKHYKNKPGLELHLIRHANTYKFPCDLCDKVFITTNDLAQHGRFHSDKKKYECKECGMKYKSSSGLSNHVNITHRNIKKYWCQICDKRFASRFALRKHMMLHGGGNVFKCVDCDMTFQRKLSLVLHRKRHMGNTSFACKVCGRAFTQAIILQKHMDVHKMDADA